VSKTKISAPQKHRHTALRKQLREYRTHLFFIFDAPGLSSDRNKHAAIGRVQTGLKENLKRCMERQQQLILSLLFVVPRER
jgi:hypothetical protein